MKKRILGLALALIMLISLLPLTAFAAGATEASIYFLGNRTYGQYCYLTSANTTEYYIAENNTFKEVAEEPADNYAKFTFDKNAALVTCTLKNFTLTTTTTSPVLWFNSGAYAINVVLEGNNAISGNGVVIRFNNSGNATITGSGNLTLNSAVRDDAILKKDVDGYLLTIQDTTLNVNGMPQTSAGAATCIWNKGPITIDKATVTTRSKYNRGISCSGAYNSETSTTATHVLTIQKGSTVLCDGVLNQARENGKAQLVAASIVIDNSNVELHKGTGGTANILPVMPEFKGSFSQTQYSDNGTAYQDMPNLEAGKAIDASYVMRHFIATHEHKASGATNDCTASATCACGYAMGAAATAHAGVITDCTKNVPCTNAGCQQNFYTAPANAAHEAAADDGDCTTAVKCKNCDQIVTPAAEKHVWDRTNCSVAGTCTNTGCTQGIAAGQHTGGTATCKDKAKCAECGEAYGELAACKPAADDGDCTTAVKCSVCGKETTAAKDAHKYTDKADTTCDNAGCTNTRKVEGTENPKTGDNTALVLCLSLMLAASAAFVCTKKFVR